MIHLLRYKLFESVDKKWEEISLDEWLKLSKYPIDIEDFIKSIKKFFISKDWRVDISRNWKTITVTSSDNSRRAEICPVEDEWFLVSFEDTIRNSITKPPTRFKCDQLDGLFDLLGKVRSGEKI